MKKTNLTRALTVVLGGGLLLAASCSVDSSEFIFDDDEYGKIKGSGGTATGDGDGDGDMGGDTSTGGMGGDNAGTGGVPGTGGGPINMPGDVRCSGKQVQFFAGGELWAPLGAPCEFLCTDGACTGDCTPDASECVSGLEARTCDAKGAWSTSTCKFACVGSKCGGSCVPGSRQCDAKQKQVCDEAGEWANDGEECTSACTASEDGTSAACTGSCVNGDTQCLNIKQRQTCQALEWKTDATDCQFACLDGACGGECDPGKSVCVGNSRQSCSSTGTKNPLVHCDGQACISGACVGDCQPGAQRCNGANIELCNSEGAWKTAEKCDGSYGEGFSCFDYTTTSGKTSQLCGECQPRASSPITRCHTLEDVNGVEACVIVDKVATWTLEEKCKGVCSRGACYSTSVAACERQPTGSTHCIDSGAHYNCGVKVPVTSCERFESCEFGSCGTPGKSTEL